MLTLTPPNPLHIVRFELTTDLYTPDNAIDFRTGEPHPDRGKCFARKGDQGQIVEYDEYTGIALVLLDNDDGIDTEVDWSELELI